MLPCAVRVLAVVVKLIETRRFPKNLDGHEGRHLALGQEIVDRMGGVECTAIQEVDTQTKNNNNIYILRVNGSAFYFIL